MPQVTKTVKCPLPGFEETTITYDLMATLKDVTILQTSVGDQDPGHVIVAIEGLPEACAKSGPFGLETPLAFQLWVVNTGLQDAIREFVRDPLSLMGSKPSTTGTPKVG